MRPTAYCIKHAKLVFLRAVEQGRTVEINGGISGGTCAFRFTNLDSRCRLPVVCSIEGVDK